ncbi:uncharacterized protein LOC142162712 [Nicotiana tabacum]|uniref:Uncharacterized protein LOC142162712 n=1 Tax=Nicotiana tabacum TaxID=4097 RepID=A0AC58RRQ7_TOBAC
MTNVVNNTQNISSSATTSAVTTSTGVRSNPKNITRVASRGGGSGGSGANGSQACAACKYQRRRCAPDCPLAPYFPAERQKDFLNAHKLFGVSNILKVLKNVPPFQKENAMKALIFEANIRADDPVGGCHRVIQNLHRQINLYQSQLQLVYHQIVRVQEAAIREQQNFNTMTSVRGTNRNLNFDMLPLHGLHGFNRSNSICLGEAGSSSQIVKGKGVERFNNVEEFEVKTMMTHSNSKQPLIESEDIKPYFGSIHNFKGKGVATELRLVLRIHHMMFSMALCQMEEYDSGIQIAESDLHLFWAGYLHFGIKGSRRDNFRFIGGLFSVGIVVAVEHGASEEMWWFMSFWATWFVLRSSVFGALFGIIAYRLSKEMGQLRGVGSAWQWK